MKRIVFAVAVFQFLLPVWSMQSDSVALSAREGFPCVMHSSTRDGLCAFEVQHQAVMAMSDTAEREYLARQRARQIEFRKKFNQFVTAVEGFAQSYNDGKGMVWPQREAGHLREAIRQLQAMEKSFREDPKAQLKGK